MKKKLLYLTSIMLFSVSAINAQTKTWDFGNDSTNWPLSTIPPVTTPVTPMTSNYQTHTVNDQLGIFPGTGVTNFGNITASNTLAGAFDPTYTGTQRFQANNAGYAGSTFVNLPTKAYLYFTVDGACTVTVWFKSANSSATRSEYLTNGTTILGSFAAVGAANAILTATVPATEAGKKLYLYSDAGINIIRIQVTGANVTTPALSTKSFQKESDVVVYAKEGKINLSNIKSSTKVNVYSVLGSLVKSVEVSGDTALDINSGVYIVNAKSAEGEKSVKVIVQ